MLKCYIEMLYAYKTVVKLLCAIDDELMMEEEESRDDEKETGL